MSDSTAVFVDTIAGLDRINLNVASSVILGNLLQDINERIPETVQKRTYLSFKSGCAIYEHQLKQTLSDIAPEGILDIRMNACLCGGKGGFGSMLRAQGGRMSKKKKANGEESSGSWKTVDGHRVRDLRKAKKLAQHLEQAQKSKQEGLERKRAKLEKILAGSTKTTSSEVSVGDETEFFEDAEALSASVRETVERACSTTATPKAATSAHKLSRFFEEESSDEN